MPNAEVKLTGEDLLIKNLEDLQENRYLLGSIRVQRLFGIYTEKDALTQKALTESCFKLETRIRNMIKNLYNDRSILESLKMNTKTEKVNRVEIIDENGRSYVKYLPAHKEVVLSFQDDDKTLKVFIQNKEIKSE